LERAIVETLGALHVHVSSAGVIFGVGLTPSRLKLGPLSHGSFLERFVSKFSSPNAEAVNKIRCCGREDLALQTADFSQS